MISSPDDWLRCFLYAASMLRHSDLCVRFAANGRIGA